jgi:hypothetical protein
MQKEKKNFYSGQAIAIVMVVLVVATVIGASLYSRTLRDKEAAIKNKNSIMALEQADTFLDLLARRDSTFLQELVDQGDELPGPFTKFGTISENDPESLLYFLDQNNIDTRIVDSKGLENWCHDKDTGSSFNISLALVEEEHEFVYKMVGSARVFNLRNIVFSEESCNLELRFDNPDSNYALFTIKKIYGTNDDEILGYSNNHMSAYCYGSCGDIEQTAAPASSFVTIPESGVININLREIVDGYNLYQVRVIPLHGTLGVAHNEITCANLKFKYIKVNAGVNCYGSYREKQVMVPGSDSVGYSPLFDYTIYNRGLLRPN